MENNAGKNVWIDEVMESTNGISRARPRADLFEQITAKINAPAAVTPAAFPAKQWVAAAILLLALNIGSAVYFTSRSHSIYSNNTNPLAAQMQVESTYNY